MKLPMQKSIETRYDTVNFENFSFHWKCFKEKGKFKIYLRYEKQWMVLFGHGNLKLVKKKCHFTWTIGPIKAHDLLSRLV